MSLIRKHGAVLQAWACLALVDTTDASDSTVSRSQRNDRSGVYSCVAFFVYVSSVALRALRCMETRLNPFQCSTGVSE